MMLLYNPKAVVLMMLISSVSIFALMLLIFERPYLQYAKYADDATPCVKDYASAVYLIIITLTTVGYGDLYPFTDGGNLVCLITAVWGGFMASLLVLIVSNLFELSDNQAEAVTQIKVNRAAARSIMYGMKYFIQRKKLITYQLKQDPGVIKTSDVLKAVLV